MFARGRSCFTGSSSSVGPTTHRSTAGSACGANDYSDRRQPSSPVARGQADAIKPVPLVDQPAASVSMRGWVACSGMTARMPHRCSRTRCARAAVGLIGDQAGRSGAWASLSESGQGEVEFDRPTTTRLKVHEQQPVLRREHVAWVRLAVQRRGRGIDRRRHTINARPRAPAHRSVDWPRAAAHRGPALERG